MTLSKATPRTGEWVFEYEMFPIWRDPESNLQTLWGSGIPGTGKTVLTSIAIREVERWSREQDLPICVCYIYIRYSDNAGLTLRHCLEVLVKQTVEKHPDCLKLAEYTYAKHLLFKTRPTEEELFQLLRSFATVLRGMFFFLDALDEAPSNLQFDLVHRLLSLNVKLFITSRPLKLLEAEFPDAHHISVAARDCDLDLHINKEIQCSPQLRRILSNQPSWRADIISSVKEKCGGMFLHASLQMAALQQCSSVCDVKETLEQFPAEIEEVYLQTWKRIIEQPLRIGLLAQTCLTWVLYATRSLTVRELQHAVASDPVTYAFDQTRLVDVDSLVASYQGLLVADEETGVVRLVHYTAKDIFERLVLNTFPHPHSLLTSVCITRLSDHGFQEWKDRDQASVYMTLRADPLLSYACAAWPTHARNSLHNMATTTHLKQFIRGCYAFPAFDNASPLLELLGPGTDTRNSLSVIAHVTHFIGGPRVFAYDDASPPFHILGSLHLVAFFNLPISLAGFGLETSENPNITTENGDTPLHVACSHNSLHTLQDLLSLPLISVNTANRCGITPLLLIVQKSDPATLRLLLTHAQVDVNLSDNMGLTPLGLAAMKGHLAMLELLLAHPQVDPNLADHWGRTPLHWVSLLGNLLAAKLLLANPRVDANQVDHQGRVALASACLAGHTSTVEILLTHPQVDVNLTNQAGVTLPAIWAVKHGNTAILRLILSHPTFNVNMADKDGRTPLLWALIENHAAGVDLLLAHPQVNVNLADKEGRTPLMWSVKDRFSKSGMGNFFNSPRLQSILNHPQVDVNGADCQGETALIMASKRGDSHSVGLLLAQPKIDSDLADAEGRTPLIHAKERGWGGIVHLLLDHKSKHNPDRPDLRSIRGCSDLGNPSRPSLPSFTVDSISVPSSHKPGGAQLAGWLRTTRASSPTIFSPSFNPSHFSKWED